MRLFEITTNNEVYAALKGLDLNVDGRAKIIEETLDVLEPLKSPSRNRAFAPLISDVITQIQNVAEADFVDDSDPSVHVLKTKAQNHLDRLLPRWNALPK